MDHSLTVVLPMHDNERRIRSSVLDLLELAHIVSRALEIVVVDDGSTDETFETACELARVYPQVTVLRQPVQRGFAAAIELVRDRMAIERVVVHDGVSPIDPAQLRILLEDDPRGKRSIEQNGSRSFEAIDAAGSRRFASIRTLHQSIEIAHRNVVGFSWIQLSKSMLPRRRSSVVGQNAKTAIPVLASGGRAAVVPTNIAVGPDN